MVAAAVDARGRDETTERAEKVAGREGGDGAAVGRGPGGVVADVPHGSPAATPAGAGLGAVALDKGALEKEWWPRGLL